MRVQYWCVSILIGVGMPFFGKLSLFLVAQIAVYLIGCAIIHAYFFRKNMYIWGGLYEYGKDDPLLMRELAVFISAISISIILWDVYFN